MNIRSELPQLYDGGKGGKAKPKPVKSTVKSTTVRHPKPTHCKQGKK